MFARCCVALLGSAHIGLVAAEQPTMTRHGLLRAEVTDPTDAHPAAAAHGHSAQEEHKHIETQARWAERIERHENQHKVAEAREGGAAGGWSTDGKGMPRQRNADPCNTTLFNASKDICFISGGRNPNKDGDNDHYKTQVWMDLLKNNYLASERGNWAPCLNAWFCGVAGIYQGVAEGTIMVSCDRPTDEYNKEQEPLKNWCIDKGAKLFQDSVLVRSNGAATLVQTFPEEKVGTVMGTLQHPTPRAGTADDEFTSKIAKKAGGEHGVTFEITFTQ